MLAEELVEAWPKRWPRPTVGSTKNSHSQIKPFGRDFAGRDVATITREEFRRWALDNPGRARYVRTMLYDALDAGIVPDNVAAGVRIPAKRAREARVPTAWDVNELAEKAPTPLFASMIIAAAYTGLRLGEQRGLKVGAVRFRRDTDIVERGIVAGQFNRQEEWVQAKTASSEETFAVLGPAVGAFDVAMSMPKVDGLLWGYTRAQHQHQWDATRELARIQVKWHSLRHHCATWLLDKGATVDDVALQLRCSVEEVRKTYGHPDREAALGRLEAIAGG